MSNTEERRVAYGRHIVGVMNRVMESPANPLFVCPHVAEDLPHRKRRVPAMICAMHTDAGVLCPPCAKAHEASHADLRCVACGNAASVAAASVTWIAPNLAVERLMTSVQDTDYELVAAKPTPVLEFYANVLLGLYDVMLCPDCAPLIANAA
jgi:hypothetical protein